MLYHMWNTRTLLSSLNDIYVNTALTTCHVPVNDNEWGSFKITGNPLIDHSKKLNNSKLEQIYLHSANSSVTFFFKKNVVFWENLSPFQTGTTEELHTAANRSRGTRRATCCFLGVFNSVGNLIQSSFWTSYWYTWASSLKSASNPPVRRNV